MLYYDRIHHSEGMDTNKTSKSKQCGICQYWDFLDKEFRFQTHDCNGCHDLLMVSINLDNIAILNKEFRTRSSLTFRQLQSVVSL